MHSRPSELSEVTIGTEADMVLNKSEWVVYPVYGHACITGASQKWRLFEKPVRVDEYTGHVWRVRNLYLEDPICIADFLYKLW